MPSLAPFLRAPLFVLALCLAATTLAAWSSRSSVRSEARHAFESQAKNLRDAISDTMKAYSQVLRAGVGFATAVGEPTHEQWQAFAAAQRFETSFPGIQGLGYAAVIAPEQIEAFEARQRASGRPNFDVQPAGKRDRYTPITFLEPEDWRNLRAIGYDMLAEPTRRTAMLHAEETGEPSLSGRVTLMQETSEGAQAGTLMYLPVFRHDGSTRAFVYGAFRMSDLISKALFNEARESLESATVRLYDGTSARPEALLFDGSPPRERTPQSKGHSPAFEFALPLTIAGAEWLLVVASTPMFEESIPASRTRAIVLVGILLSALIALIVGTIVNNQLRMTAAAALLANEVATRKQAEEAAGLANRELIHRAKNTIAVISAIASQTARHSKTIDGFMHDFRDRLNALARIQDMLRPDQQRATELKDLIEVVLKPHTANVEERLTLAGPVVPVPQNEALVLSLLINELATNATKYGAWSVPQGKVDVAWQIDRTATPAMLKLAWQERGGPPVEAPQRRGFGSSVLAFVVERSMNGTLLTEFAAAGIRHEFEVPWPALQS